MRLTRRSFCSKSAVALLSPHLLRSQSRTAANPAPAPSATAHVDVAAVDHDRILTAAALYLDQAPAPLTSFPASASPGTSHDFYSEGELPGKDAVNMPSFTAHSDALLNFSIQASALTAAYVLTGDARYAVHAATHLRAWFADPATRMTPNLPYASMIPGNPASRFEGILETVHLAEVAQAVSFLTHNDALSPQDLAAVYAWFAAYLEWLGSARVALLARDQRSHHGTSWLLQAAAFARLAPEPNAGIRKPSPPTAQHYQTESPNEVIGLINLRHQFRTVTLRAQIAAEGGFPRELSSPLPYRNSLFNLDMLAGICDLLSTRFESAWEYELQDGPGMHVAIAHHFPYIAHRGAWPYHADSDHFTALPLRQPSLLLSGRAYSRPEYIDLWKTLPPDPPDLVLQRTFPIRQPLLWVRRAPAL